MSFECRFCGKEFDTNRGRGIHEGQVHEDDRKPSKEELERMYWEKEMSAREIGEKVGVSYKTIGRWMRDYGIPTRSPSEAGKLMKLPDYSGDKNPNWRGGNVKVTCANCGETKKVRPCIANSRRNHFCNPTCYYEWKKGKNWEDYFDEETLEKMRRVWKIIGENADHLEEVRPDNPMESEESRKKVSKALTGRPTPQKVREKISKSLKGRFVGKKSPRWIEEANHYRGENWSRQRRKALERDNYTCQICGKTKADLEMEPDVHHITPFREFGNYREANKLSNLVVLCRSCHQFVENKLKRPDEHPTSSTESDLEQKSIEYFQRLAPMFQPS